MIFDPSKETRPEVLAAEEEYFGCKPCFEKGRNRHVFQSGFNAGAASRDAEIESLRQQIDNLAVDITLLRRQVSALEKQDGELESMRQQLAAAQATIKAKDDYLRLLIGYTSESTVASLIVQKALAATEPKL